VSEYKPVSEHKYDESTNTVNPSTHSSTQSSLNHHSTKKGGMGWSILEPISADVCGVSVRRFAKEPIRVEENLAIVTDSLLIFCPQTIMDARGSEDVGGGGGGGQHPTPPRARDGGGGGGHTPHTPHNTHTQHIHVQSKMRSSNEEPLSVPLPNHRVSGRYLYRS
jgi:hypothetical protein